MKTLNLKKTGFKPLQPEWDPTLWRITDAFDFYNKQLKPHVADVYQYGESGIHGLETHTMSVVFRGIDCAIHLGNDPIPVIFACAFHDMARTSDDADIEHGKKASQNAIRIMKQFPNLLDDKTRVQILSAVSNHTNGKFAPDYISACLWDADRARMSWKYGFDPKFFNTTRGMFIAQHFQKYLDYQRRAFPGYDWSKQY